MPDCKTIEPDEFLSLATSRMPMRRTEAPGAGLVGLTDASTGRQVVVDSRKLERHRLRGN